MRAESNIRPKKNYSIDIRKDKAIITFFDNIQEVTENEESKYIYDVFEIKIQNREDLEQKLEDEGYYDSLLELAKEEYGQKLADEIRKIRDELLQETDKFLLEDFPISEEQKEKYKIYRNALREIPEQQGFPYEVSWPSLEE